MPLSLQEIYDREVEESITKMTLKATDFLDGAWWAIDNKRIMPAQQVEAGRAILKLVFLASTGLSNYGCIEKG